MEELFSGIIPILIVIFVVSSIISSAKKKAAKQNQRQGQSGQQGQAPPPQPQKPMSEIQRAFMMMAGIEEEQQAKPVSKPAPKAAPMNAPQQARSQPYQHGEGFHSTHEGMHGSHHEGLHGKHEGLHGQHEGLRSKHHEGLHGRHEGLRSHEGTHGREAMAAYQTLGQQASVSKYANVKIDRYFADEDEDEAPMVVRRGKRSKGGLKLFENQNDYVKAVIYSEVLTRKTARR